MAKFSKKVGGKEIGDAKVYAKPHTMSGGSVKNTKVQDPNKLTAGQLKPGMVPPRVSAGDPAREDAKKTGIKIRGTGAATKGTMARGPMG